MKRYLMYKFIMKYLTDKDLSLNAKAIDSLYKGTIKKD